MLYANPDDFVLLRRRIAAKELVRMSLKRASKCLLTRDELCALTVSLKECVAFGDVGVTSRVVYLRTVEGKVRVREFIRGVVTTSYDIDLTASTRDLNLEFAVIDGIVRKLEWITAAQSVRLMEGVFAKEN